MVTFAISLLTATLVGASTLAEVLVLPRKPSATAQLAASVAHELI